MRRATEPSYLILLRVGFAEHPWSPRDLVSSYLTGSPEPADEPPAVCFLLHFPRLATSPR